MFPETADPLGALRWCLAALRKALNSADCLRGDPVDCNLPADVTVDVRLLDAAAFDAASAGQLPAGIEPRCSAEFATWLLVERERIASIVEGRIREQAIRAMSVTRSRPGHPAGGKRRGALNSEEFVAAGLIQL